jgi:DNA repair protein RecO (recombination protein O)
LTKYHHTEGICLRRIEFSNTSQVASFLTPDAGRLSVIAKGVTRAPRKGIRTGFDLLGRYELVYAARRTTSLQNLTYRWLREDFRGVRRSLERLLCGYYAAELGLDFAAEGEPCPPLYDAVLRSLRRFAAGRKLGTTVLMLELAALREQGAVPRFDACAACGKPLPSRGRVAFSFADGGPLCRGCEGRSQPGGTRGTPSAPPRSQGPKAPAELLRVLAVLSANPDAEPPALGPEETVAMSALLRMHMRFLLGKELRMWKYLQGQKLTRSLDRLRRSIRARRARRAG